MDRYGRVVFAVLSLGLLLAIAGCSHTPRGIHQVGNWGPVTFLEDGIRVSLYAKQTENYRGSSLLYGSRYSDYSILLTENPTGWKRGGFDDDEVRQLWHTAPPWRRQENLQAVVERMVPGAASADERYLISSHGPVVVGLTGQTSEFAYLNLFLDSKDPDKTLRRTGRRIRKLLVYRGWPAPDATLGPLPDVQVIELATPMSVLEVFAARPWEGSASPKK